MLYNLNGLNNWLGLAIRTISVNRVLGINIKKRQFMIIDINHPYLLEITYEKRVRKLARHCKHSMVIKRYETYELAQRDMNAIYNIIAAIK
jgi:hypothetical protein